MVERMLDATIGVGSHCRRRYCYCHSYWSRIPRRRNIRIPNPGSDLGMRDETNRQEVSHP